MKTPLNKPTLPFLRRNHGFALVISLSLMVLLTVLAVGLLTLSTVSLRSSSHASAMATARANARMALMLAIGDLQKKAGPDQRVTAPGNLVDNSQPMGLTGVWKSWKPDATSVEEGDYAEHKAGDNFLGYLMSNPEPSETPKPGELPSGDETETLVGEGSLGKGSTAGKELKVPVVKTVLSGGDEPDGGFAWVALDEGVKARMDLEPADEAKGLGEQLTRLGAPARNRFLQMKGMEFLEGDDEEELRKELPKLVTLKEADLKSGSRDEIAGYFHDFTVYSASLQTNVAEGGLKTDLSVLFEGDYRANLPGDYASRYVYSDDPVPFPDSASNSDFRWSLLANYARLYRLATSADGSALAGLKAKVPTGYQLKPVTDNSVTPAMVRYEPRMCNIKEPVLMPTVVRVDTVFSLVARKAHQGRGTSNYPNQLHMMYLPVVTLHNPFNTTLRCTNFQVEFSDIPVGFQFLVNGQPTNSDGKLKPLNSLFMGSAAKKSFAVTLSNSLSANNEVVMGPGETRIFGTPFSKDATWASEVAANGAVMFDWANNKTANVRMVPGMITGPNDGIGFDVDWLSPDPRSTWVNSRRDEGVLMLANTDKIQVRFGPAMPPSFTSNNGVFAITTKMANLEVGKTQVFYKNEATLRPLLSEGTSPRFSDERDFPAMFPASGGSPLMATSLLEQDGTRFRDYVNARPFAVFSVGAKTTVEAFTKGRPVADNGIAFQMATCDFRNSTSQGASPLEFALVPVKNGSAAIEVDGSKAFFFGGHGSTNGTTTASIYEIPLAPLQSIAQLRHANGASLGSAPFVTYTFGESRAHPAIPSNVTFQKSGGSKLMLDHVWLSNASTWDRYWFSTLSSLDGPAYSGSSAMKQAELAGKFFDGERPLPNPRNIPYFPAGKPAEPVKAAEEAVAGDGKNAAAYIVTEGGFNVNSTSVAAWTAALAGLSQSEIPLSSSAIETSDDSPFPRLRRPNAGREDPDKTPTDKLWNAYRVLDAGQVKTLAEKIVDEVRNRGPFLSMGEFVNRRIGGSGDLTNSGALQAALDKSKLNDIMESNARTVTPAEVGTYGWLNPGAVTGNTGAGAPGEISQGDLLTVLGSFATVRSDTFVIRSYGDARDPDGKIVARAWCEATVQRVPEYVDGADAPEAIAVAQSNIQFGRRFKVVAFRWLSADEC